MNGRTRFSDVIGSVAGVVFAVSLLSSVAMIDPQRSVSDQDLLAWWNDDANLRSAIISMYAMLIAAASFLVFVTALRVRLDDAAENRAWPGLVQAAGTGFAVMLSLSAIARALIPLAVRVNDDPLPGPDTLRYATELQYSAFGLAAMPFAVTVVAVASILFVRERILSRWLGWLGIGIAVATVALVAALAGPLASPLILIWVVATSVQLFRTRVAGEPVGTIRGEAGRTDAQGVVPVA